MGTACAGAGREVRFFTCAQLVLLLVRSSAEGRPGRLMADVARCDLPMLGEFGHVPIDVQGARLLFQVTGECHEGRSMIVTTNIEFSKRGIVLGDDRLASALMDRVVHHGRLVEFGGASRRMEEALMLGKGGGDAAR